MLDAAQAAASFLKDHSRPDPLCVPPDPAEREFLPEALGRGPGGMLGLASRPWAPITWLVSWVCVMLSSCKDSLF